MKNFEVTIPEAFTVKNTVGIPKLTPDQVAENFVENLKNLTPFYEGKKVGFFELKYGRKTEVMIGMEQVLGEKGKAKLVGVEYAGHNADPTDVKISVNKVETTCLNLTGLWKVGEGKPFRASIFAGKF